MKNYLTLKPISKISGCIKLPGSKSISNRVLLISAQAVGTTKIFNLLKSEDVNLMLIALKNIGIKYDINFKKKYCIVYGIGSALKPKNDMSIFLGNSGTSMRLLTAALCLQNKLVKLDCDSRMKERPIGDLVQSLILGGAKIKYLEKEFYPPIIVQGNFNGGEIIINASLSSQFLTSLLILAPLCNNDTYIKIKGTLVSKPYIDITLSIMKIFGVEIFNDNYKLFYIKGKNIYKSPGNFLIEGDASSASYFLAAAAIKGGTIKIKGLNKKSIQGDINFINILSKMGAQIKFGNNYIKCTKNYLNPIDIDMNDMPDVSMTIAMVALFVKEGTTNIRNIFNLRLKECDRILALANELRKIGAHVIEGKDYLSITPPKKFKYAVIETYNDHRIAMCFSLIALSGIKVTILNPNCTYKTFPNFFKLLSSISFFK